jgi:aminoglycoside/choline kinase family phosphotransferase
MVADDNWRGSWLAGDGSNRLFLRLQKDGQRLMAVFPGMSSSGQDDGKQRAEARSAFLIGQHLYAAGVPVPTIFAYDEETGILIYEDLGDILLHDELRQSPDPARLLSRYQEVIRILLHLQLAGARNFDPTWCWDTQRYDRQLMLERESQYFIRSLCRDYLGMTTVEPGLALEFQALADRAAREPADFFLHRDFQSRNLMIHQGKIRVIDFQGGRLGPLAYDLASLLIDPYMGLAGEVQEKLLAYYLKEAEKQGIEPEPLLEAYPYLALQRNLQVLGAFAFLGKEQGKIFFIQFIRPALASLHEHLAKPLFADYPSLRKLAAECLQQF